MTNQGSLGSFQPSWELQKYYTVFKLVLSNYFMPESSRLEFLEKFSANNFALSDAEDNNSFPLNKGGIADLHLIRFTLDLQSSKSP